MGGDKCAHNSGGTTVGQAGAAAPGLLGQTPIPLARWRQTIMEARSEQAQPWRKTGRGEDAMSAWAVGGEVAAGTPPRSARRRAAHTKPRRRGIEPEPPTARRGEATRGTT